MLTWFKAGGFPMFFILGFGVLTIAAALRYATTTRKEELPVVVALGILTLLTGAFGFVTGVVVTMSHIAEVPAADRFLWMIGLGESLVNASFALALTVVAAVATTVGTWRAAVARA